MRHYTHPLALLTTEPRPGKLRGVVIATHRKAAPNMLRLKTFIAFLFQSVTLGLALAFIAVWLRPELLGERASGNDSFSAAVASAAPSVVNIHSARRVNPLSFPQFEDPLLRRYLEDNRGLEQPIESTLGSGVIVSADGYILTNNHVISGAEAIQVALADGRIADADIVGSDPDTDLALLKIGLTGLPAIRLGRSDSIRVGDVVLAIGNPYGVGQTVTQGIVSATGRSSIGHATFENFIQTDAAINPGNSGGALINTRGELVGVNSAVFSRSGASTGIGFAVPVNLARGVLQQLIEHGRVIRGWLGVDPQDLTPELAEAFGLPSTQGFVVREVLPGSPAEAAGLERGDAITHLDGRPIANAREALNIIASFQPGQVLRIRGVRSGEPFVSSAIVTERSPQGRG
ncbi:MAG TPA: trypsin-like peptidase domain-containing protein [Gammaproteobacteria bacterium]|nr:trypsin-like peptidase domain-containing protein [Gammaproteobacteria bacterium]